MARTVSLPARPYAVGVHGPYPIDAITKADTSALEWWATVDPSWPTDPSLALFRVTLAWDTGGAATWTVNAGRRDASGAPVATIRERVLVPEEGDGSGARKKSDVWGGSLTVEVLRPLRTSFGVAAVA